MKRLDVITPRGNDLVTLYQDVNCATGSILINDEFHDAFLSMNGRLIGPIGAGRYSLDPGFSPFFPNLRTYATGGRPSSNVSVFYIRRSRTVLPWSTGEFVYNERIATGRLPVRAAAGGQLILSVEDSRRFLTAIVGLRGFDEDETNGVIHTFVVPPIRSALAEELAQRSISAVQGRLTSLSPSLLARMAPAFREFGLRLCNISVGAVNLNGEDLAKLQKLGHQRIAAAVDLEAERNRLNEIYGGNVFNRTASDAMLALAGNRGMMGSPMAQMAMLPALMGTASQWGGEMRRMMEHAVGQADIHGNEDPARRTPHESTAQRCPGCGAIVTTPGGFCPHCGRNLTE